MTSPDINSAQSRSIVKNGRRIYLLKVARAQRVLILLVLAALLTYFLMMILTVSAGGGSYGSMMVIAAVLGLAYFGIMIAAIVQTVRLVLASGGNTAIAVIVAILMLIPCIGLLTLLVANQRATSLLKQFRVHVGFLGVTPAEMVKLIEGACPGCGYDIRGLPASTCPECGAAFTPPTMPHVPANPA